MAEPEDWDICEITYSLTYDPNTGSSLAHKDGWLQFVAQVNGPNGRYTAAKSPKTPVVHHLGASVVPTKTNAIIQSLHQDFMHQLQKDGWEKNIEHGKEWYAQRFKRKSRKRSFLQRLFGTG